MLMILQLLTRVLNSAWQYPRVKKILTLSANGDKTKIMYVRPCHLFQHPPINIKYKSFCKEQSEQESGLEVVPEYKYLGVVVDQYLKWHTHINNVRKKLRKASYILSQLSYCSNKQALKIV